MIKSRIPLSPHHNASSPLQDAAAFLAAKFFTRPEMVGRHLPTFVEFCKGTVRDAAADDFLQGRIV